MRLLRRLNPLGVFYAIRLMPEAFAEWLLGPRCPKGCGQRLYVKDRTYHLNTEHAGDHR